MAANNKAQGNGELIATLQSQTNHNKGLGYMWSESTRAVGTTFGALGNLADAGNQLAITAKRNAVQANLESSGEICKALGIEATGMDQLLVSEAIVDYICSRR
jgi:hypothetical protein